MPRYVRGILYFGGLKGAALLLVVAVCYRLVLGGLAGHGHCKLRLKGRASRRTHHKLSASRGEVDCEHHGHRNIVFCGGVLGLNLQFHAVRARQVRERIPNPHVRYVVVHRKGSNHLIVVEDRREEDHVVWVYAGVGDVEDQIIV